MGGQIYHSYSDKSILEVFRYYVFFYQSPRTWHLDGSGVEDGVSGLYPMRFVVGDDELLTCIEPAPQFPGPDRAFLLSELKILDILRIWLDEKRKAVGQVP